MKLYEILMRKLGIGDSKEESSIPKLDFYNPLTAKVGGVVKIDTIEYRDHRFIIKDILENTIRVGGKVHKNTDYILESRPINKEDVTLCLRVVPNNDSNSRITHRALGLSVYDSLAYDEGLHNVLKEDTQFNIDDDKSDNNPDNDTHEEFWRVNDVKTSYTRSVKSLGKEGKPEELDSVEFWDYSRMTEIDSVQVEEFVYAEMNKRTGWFTIWRGAEIIPERIEVF